MAAARVVPALSVLFLIAPGCSATEHRRNARISDPPLLVPWSKIGHISLGERRERVEREYGSKGRGYHVLVTGQALSQGYYRLHGDRVYVEFEDGRVNEISFSTRYYRTKHGFGVGSKIPFGPCHRTATKRCEHRWHGFVWNAWVKEEPCQCWVKVGRGRTSLAATVENFLKPWTAIYARHGRVTGFLLAWKFVD
jgi:hypothetical protein